MNLKRLTLYQHGEDRIEQLLQEQQISRKELKSRVQLLKAWIHKQPHLPNCMGENELENFLWSSKASMEITKERIDAYYSARSQLPEIFEDRNPCSKDMLRNSTAGKVFPLPKLTEEGYRVIFASLTTVPASEFSFISACKEIINMCDILLMKESLPAGQYIILDGKNTTMGHVLKIQPTILRKILYYIQTVLPNQIKGIFLINASYMTEIIHMTMMPLMSKKLQKRIHILNGDHTELYDYIDRKVLPQEYGGDGCKTDDLRDAWQRKLEYHRDWLMNEGTLTSDEIKRPGKENFTLKNPQFGTTGSFKRLEID